VVAPLPGGGDTGRDARRDGQARVPARARGRGLGPERPAAQAGGHLGPLGPGGVEPGPGPVERRAPLPCWPSGPSAWSAS
jgi:hypothetical protein